MEIDIYSIDKKIRDIWSKNKEKIEKKQGKKEKAP